MQIDENRLARQTIEVDKVINHFISGVSRGVAGEFPTGFGKTYMAFLAIKRIPINKIVHVIVPTEALKNQWEKLILEQLPNYNIKVFIINTYVMELRVCDFLLIDEGHKISNKDAVMFSLVLDICTFVNCWILSAKFTTEQLLFLESKDIKLISKITVEEAKKNNWVSQYKIYNLAIDLTTQEEEEYIKVDNIFKSHFPYFNNDLKLLYELLQNKEARLSYCNENDFNEQDIAMRAVRATAAISKRKSIVYNAFNKKQIIADIVKLVNKKTIVFSQTIKFCQEVKKLVDKSTIYHSNLKPKEKEAALLGIITDKYNCILSVKALQEGLDVKGLQCGIRASYDSTERGMIQTLGRVIRKEENKEFAVFVSLYCKNTMEIGWLKTSQKSFANVRWIESINEIEL
jgi:superfamily II DNA or RNA helicase